MQSLPPNRRAHARLAFLVLALVIAPALAGSAGAQSSEVVAGEALAKLGVPSYRVNVSGTTATVELLELDKNVAGTVELSWRQDEGALMELDRPGAHLILLFDPLAKGIRLTNLDTAETAAATLGPDGWVADKYNRTFFELYAAEIALLSELHDDVLTNHVQGERIREQPECSAPTAPSPEEFLQLDDKAICITCNGLWVRGSTWAQTTRSACCEAAKQDAHLKCWNKHCIGCCALLDCDANCFLGDYLCAPCGITGISCSGRICDTPPPPGCATTADDVTVLEVAGGGAYQLPSGKITLSRLENSTAMHGDKAVSYLMEEWAVLAFGATDEATKSAPVARSLRSSSDELGPALADHLGDLLNAGRFGKRQAGSEDRIALVVAHAPHEANSRQIDMPTLRVSQDALPDGSGQGKVVVRADFAEGGAIQAFDVLYDTYGGVSPELALHLQDSLYLERTSDKQHRVVAFAVLSVGESVTVDSNLVIVPKCCCGDFFCE